jgi:O-antigen/teichoic acid export membrane protein
MDPIASKNIWHASVSIIIPSIFTYMFWFLCARLGGAEPVGVASSIASLVIIVSTIVGLDMSLGMKRMMGLAISSGDISEFKQILVSTVIFITLIIIVSSTLILIPEFGILDAVGVDKQYALIIVAMIFAQSFQYIFIEAIIASLQSKKLLMPFLLGSLARFPILFAIFFILDSFTMEIVIAFSSLLFITSFCFGIYLIRFMNQSKRRPVGNFYFYVKKVLRAGLASWIPHTLNVAGYWLGIIAVFSSDGASEGGKFYIAVGIFTVTLFVVIGITKVIHAQIPSIRNEKEQIQFLVYYISIAFISTMPFAAPLFLFSSDYLELIGEEFRSAATSVSIFIISIPFVIVSEIIYYFVYGRGDHRAVLYLGLTGNIPRIVLYFILSPLFGINGAAVSFLIGSILQFGASLKFMDRYHVNFNLRKYLAWTLVPIGIGIPMWIANINFVISTAIIIAVSFLLYIKYRLITDSEAHDIIYAVFPQSLAKDVYPHFTRIASKLSSKK